LARLQAELLRQVAINLLTKATDAVANASDKTVTVTLGAAPKTRQIRG